MSKKILVIADGRSPTARSWIAHLLKLDFEVSLVSTYHCEPVPGISKSIILPLALSRFQPATSPKESKSAHTSSATQIKKFAHRFSPLLLKLRYVVGPLSARMASKKYLAFLDQVRPDLVHALRIPYEGMLGRFTPEGIPFIVATWGNDLTLHAAGSPWMKAATHRCLERADGLTSDTLRDIRLAHEWGLRPEAPTLEVPGSGGLDLDAIDHISTAEFDPEKYKLPASGPWVVNPRGMRPGSVHQDVFFEAIPKILAQAQDTVFICPALAGIRQAEEWVRQWNIADRTFLLPKLPQNELFALFKRSQVFVSPSSHDGTPNTLLEALACGCTPVAGRIESLEKWITPGVNGDLVNPRDADALAKAVIAALQSPEKRKQAAEANREILLTYSADQATLPAIAAFYSQFLPK